MKVGNVEADDVFVVGDSDDEDEGGGQRSEAGQRHDAAPASPLQPDINYSTVESRTGTDLPPPYSSREAVSGGKEPEVPSISHSGPLEYWIKPGDTLIGIALKHGIDGRLLCKLNNLPPSTLSVTPHLLHTRTTLTFPPTSRRAPSPPPSNVQERREKEKATRRFQSVTKEVDDTVARTYVSLAEGEQDHNKEDTKVRPDSSLEGRAIDQYMDDEQWEVEQRRLGSGYNIRASSTGSVSPVAFHLILSLPPSILPMASTKTFTREEVAKHNKQGDLWIVIDAKVYDISKFSRHHPGGLSVLLDEEVAGKDATQVFFSLHRQEVLQKPGYAKLQIGVLEGEKSIIKAPQPGSISKIPYAEPTWLTPGFHSPYFKESHKRLVTALRKFVDEVVYPDGQAREADGKRVSQSVVDALAEKNVLAMRLGPGKHLKGRYDYFHEMIINQELSRIGVRGYGDGLLSGMVIGLPPVLNFGSEELKARIVPDIFAGKKFISLAISEAFAGSDVSGIRTTAKLTEDGKHWIINGTKKWITNGHGGFTVILVERGEGVETSPIKTSYSPAAGTAFVTFDNVKVPVGNTLGPVDGGLIVMLANFNHERWVMCCCSARAQRLVVEECLKWVNQRIVFGKPLVSQAVVRSKLADMISRVESAQNWLEHITYQMNHMNYKQQSAHLAGQIGFLKKYCTSTAQETARDAVQIFGGRGITKTGMGRFIEHYHTTVTFDSLLGGAEDVLGDLGVRQAMRKMPKDARL
ncbi:hypothetical protein FRB99_007267 [Tulasnella sp. 403]|nr:hypothetical protein FRB99_007267 [Tulasnella sp. 403]